MEAFRQDYEQLRRSHDLPAELDIKPVVVVQPGPVFERARSSDISVVTGTDFLSLAGNVTSFGGLVEAVQAYEAPRIKVVESTERTARLGTYTFRMPSYYIPESELARCGFIYEAPEPQMPWDLSSLPNAPKVDPPVAGGLKRRR